MAFGTKAARSEKIFVNYRREDAGGFAGRLSDSLANYFGAGRVFRDVTGIDYGHDFEKVIDEKLEESGALVVMIGERWTSVTDAEGKRRLDDPGDYVVREIAAALRNGVPVLPVLIGEASMPRTEELPASLAELARRNAISLTDERWDFDVDRLAKVLTIDVPGTVAQRRLDWMKAAALAMLVLGGAIATLVFCAALGTWRPPEGLREAGFSPIVSAIPFMAIVFAGALTLNAAPAMEPGKRKYAWASVALATVGTLGAFIAYALRNVAEPNGSLVANFGASTITIFGMLALLALAGFRAK
ncbi:toll/interleukin-1 receptor domain-containing protein [Parasphingopyxis marina]|uniref:Toll/interleukin-1 receptor domain-containing protein n=1 Tax=Parasphingopyxis marina TaxID=2761622 RepID=A0A842HWG0_9SPHN|nr:toll/interleukin-1 receptor domain-containing protein [Parasphingopyxis marina]MBC2777302.1 toll/interleukin-1 receptor domain-containing protein [Parasphingopyxis marina]